MFKFWSLAQNCLFTFRNCLHTIHNIVKQAHAKDIAHDIPAWPCNLSVHYSKIWRWKMRHGQKSRPNTNFAIYFNTSTMISPFLTTSHHLHECASFYPCSFADISEAAIDSDLILFEWWRWRPKLSLHQISALWINPLYLKNLSENCYVEHQNFARKWVWLPRDVR